MTAALIPVLVFLPLAGALLVILSPVAWARAITLATWGGVGTVLYQLTALVARDGPQHYALGALAAPVGIRLHVDGFAVALLWLVLVVMGAASTHACASIGAKPGTRYFWAAWLTLATGLHALLVTGDLFNLYVGLELVTLSAVALVASGGTNAALRAALRYLLLGMFASLLYLLGVALVYATAGTLDLMQVRQLALDGALPPSSATAASALMTGGLLIKAAMFPLHGWLPEAHASAPGPVSAALSALVVKAAVYLLYRLWFEVLPPPPLAAAGTLLATMGAAGIIFGSVMALKQERLKRLVAYSTVAQLGYLLLPFDLPLAVAWHGAVSHMLAHGVAKAAMFLAAANLKQGLGGDELSRLPGADRRMPVSVFAFGLAGVSLMGLPPSGGFLAKWQLLEAAWQLGAWHWVVVVLAGSLLAAAYVFRVVGLVYSRPTPAPSHQDKLAEGLCGSSALALALVAIAAGFGLAPALELVTAPELLTGARP